MRPPSLAVLALLSSTACVDAPAPRPAPQLAPAAAAAADPAPPQLRLPGDVKPLRYRLELTVLPAEQRAAGAIHIDATVVRPTGVVWLNATGLDVSKAELGGKPARLIPGGEDFLGLAAGGELPIGPLAIDLAFSAPIDQTRSRGLYSEKEAGEPYLYTFFEPIDARRAFPCFDEPAFKVPWQLTLHVRQEHVALGNAPVVKETAEPGGMKRVELAESKPLPSYLVALVVGPFEVVDGGLAGRAQTPVRFVVPKGRAGELGWAKQVTPRTVAALEDYFDMDYPYGKLDVAVVPRYWGTMEHPGLVAMGQGLTLIRPEQATRARRQAYANILAHELSHYWFGDYVTNAWWDDTWLNEALGTWSDMNVTDALEPGWGYRDQRVPLALGAMAADETLSALPVRRPVVTREAIGASFDNDLTYFKGASLLRMFEAFAGRERWRGFLRGYLRDHAWGVATAEDFTSAMGAALGQPLADSFRSLLGEPGVPLVTARIACAEKSIALELRRSLPAGVSDPAPHAWKVPLCVRFGDAAHQDRACAITDGPTRIPLTGGCPTWLLPNADAVGYYRSEIDPAVARGLLDPASAIAKAARPAAAERMMTVADLRAMVQRQALPLDRLLELVPLIAADPDPKVALWALTAVSFPVSALDDGLHAAARKWLAATFGPRARALGWHRAPGDSDELQKLRVQQLPLVARDDEALGAEAERLADQWLRDRTGLDDDLVQAALRVAARRGDAARFDRTLAAARTARDRREQSLVLGALAGVRDPALALRALELVRGREFDLRDTMWIAAGLLGNRETRDLALGWMGEHLDELLGRMRDDEASWFLGGIAGAFCDPVRRKAIGELVSPRAPKHEGAQVTVTRALEQSDQCIAGLARELPALTRFLGR